MDPRFQYFYDYVRIINFFQREQAAPMIYILENDYLGEKCTVAVCKAGELVQAIIGAPVIVDAAHLGSAAHRVRLFWTNMLQPAILQQALLALLPPSPPLDTILKSGNDIWTSCVRWARCQNLKQIKERNTSGHGTFWGAKVLYHL